MKKIFPVFLAVFSFFAFQISAQIPVQTLVQISKAEDRLRFDKTLEDLMKSPNAKIRARAALASGRIGRESAIPFLADLLEKDSDAKTRSTAAFSIGEIESIGGADAILKALQNTGSAIEVRARAIEAAGKIAAANAKDEKSKLLGKAILDTLLFENNRGAQANNTVVLFGITAILRAKPEGGEQTAAKFLISSDAPIRAAAANTLSRLRAKNADEQLRKMLVGDTDDVARANAARALGAAEDKDSFDLLLNAAISDKDSRVRVSAIRSLGSLKDAKAADRLLKRGENLLKAYKKEFYAIAPSEKNELLEIATTLGRILPNSDDEKVLNFLNGFGVKDSYNSSEIFIAIAKISPANFLKIDVPNFICDVNYTRITPSCWRFNSANAQGLGEFADLDSNNPLRDKAAGILRERLKSYKKSEFATDQINILAIPDMVIAFAKFKTTELPEILRAFLTYRDIFVQSAAAELVGEQPATKENVEMLKIAFAESLKTDKFYNDAQLAILSALVKLDKQQSLESLRLALNAPDYLVRRRAAQLIKQNDLSKEFPNADEKVGTVKPYNPQTGTKLGQILNSSADYVRAASRTSAQAVLTTEKGTFTIEFFPEAAPLTVDNFIRFANAKYFDGLTIHRVVPNFVMQDGDPRGDGNGGPGWEIRDEINTIGFERGTVGMALSGKDTGGSQWFVCHSPQPHLDGGYTVFGRVNENDMKIVDNLVRGDKILSVKIIENKFPVLRNKK